MREFFKPWRRKFGCVTLLMASIITVLWVRGTSVCDQFVFKAGGDFHSIESLPGRLTWFRVSGSKAHAQQLIEWTTNGKDKDDPTPPAVVRNEQPQSQFVYFNRSKWMRSGLKYIVGEWQIGMEPPAGNARFYVLELPCWMLVSPLLLVSTILLLMRPRPSANKQLAEPAATEGEA